MALTGIICVFWLSCICIKFPMWISHLNQAINVVRSVKVGRRGGLCWAASGGGGSGCSWAGVDLCICVFDFQVFVSNFPYGFLISTNVVRSVEVGGAGWAASGEGGSGRSWAGVEPPFLLQLAAGGLPVRGPVVTTSRRHLVTPRGGPRHIQPR